MSRLNIKENINDNDDEINNIISDLNSPKEKIIVLWDYDSMLHFCLYSGKNELGEKNPEYTKNDLEFLKSKLTEMTLKILNKVEQYYDIVSCYIFVKGNSNFRKELYPDYKANRLESNPLISELYKYAIEIHQAIPADNCEAEDMVYKASKKINHQGLILYVDHDLLEIPSRFMNYRTGVFSKVTEKEATYNLYKKLCLSEPGDNVKTSPGIGEKYFQKNFHIDMTIEEYEEALKKAYLKSWKNNVEKATEQLNLAKKLLMLRDECDL